MNYPVDVLDRKRLEAGTVAARVELFDTLGSTQDHAQTLVREGRHAPLPLLVAAEEQTAGRGRGANRWWTGRGSLAFSLVFDPVRWGLPAGPLPTRSLAVGVAIVDTLAPLISEPSLGLHWPNDVFVAGKKVAGVLIDVLPNGLHIVGIGLNVNNSLHGAPEDVRARAISLRDLAGRTFDRTDLLLALLKNLKHAICTASAEPEEFGRRFEQLCLQAGKQLTIDVGGRQTTGICAGIAADGALLLDTIEGRQEFYSGVLQH